MNFHGIFCGTWKFHIMKIFTNHIVKISNASHRSAKLKKPSLQNEGFLFGLFCWLGKGYLKISLRFIVN